MKIGVKIFTYVIGILILIYAGFRWWQDYQTEQNVAFNKGIAIGKVFNYYVIFPQNRFIEYDYLVNGNYFRNKTQIPTGISNRKWNKGSSLKVMYYLKDHTQSLIDFNCILPDSLNIYNDPLTVVCDTP